MSKYLDFVDATPDGRKTKVMEVRSKRSGDLLGVIKWFGRWRQYTFFPEPETTFNTECMANISGAIIGLMAERTQPKPVPAAHIITDERPVCTSEGDFLGDPVPCDLHEGHTGKHLWQRPMSFEEYEWTDRSRRVKKVAQ